jgi:outer membrane protein assembly factor BamB
MIATLVLGLLAAPNPLAQAPDAATVEQERSEQAAPLDPMAQWGQWRGPTGCGVAPLADPPIEWSEDSNVRWKSPLTGSGQGTPIVWGQRIYLTAAVPTEALPEPLPDESPGGHDNAPRTHEQAFVVLALDRASGEVLWETEVHAGLPHQGAHETATLASASPLTDGERVYASFGSNGIYALGLDGGGRWRADLGAMDVKHGHGEGASPALLDGALVVNWDHEGPSFVVALEAETGEERWRVPRDEITSWSTPLPLVHDGVAQVVVPGTKAVRSYRLDDGEVLWECGGLSANIVASPVAGGGLVFAGSSYEIRRLMALRLGGELDCEQRVVWSRTQGTPYVPSLLLLDDALYFVRHYQNVMTRVDAASGAEVPGAFRLEGIGNVYASPVGVPGRADVNGPTAGARLYVTDLEGTTLVLSADGSPRTLAVNHLDDSFAASAAIAGEELFLRGERYLYCLARD